jgi:hypothetical protein
MHIKLCFSIEGWCNCTTNLFTLWMLRIWQHGYQDWLKQQMFMHVMHSWQAVSWMIPQKMHSRAREVLEVIHTNICGPFSFHHSLDLGISSPLLMITIEKLGCNYWRNFLMHCLHSKPSRMNLKKRQEK